MVGLVQGRLFFSGYKIFVVLHSFLSFASLPICLSLAQEIGGLSATGVVVSIIVLYIGHILVAMSWYV